MSKGGRPRKVKVVPTRGFVETFKLFKSDEILKTLTIFNHYKREIPPRDLPAEMRDHHLTGRLAGFKDCHLAPDVILIYTHKADIVTLFRVCTHADLIGPQEKALAKAVRKAKTARSNGK